jgi:hypothetical protein
MVLEHAAAIVARRTEAHSRRYLNPRRGVNAWSAGNSFGLMGRTRRLLVLAVMSVFVTAGCVTHAIGPARTTSTYEHKAVATAETALSSLATVLLVADVATAGKAWKPYVDVAMSEQEDALAAVEGGFASIQPPTSEADEVRTELLPLLRRTQDHVAAVRIEARRGHLDQLAAVSSPLLDDQRDLQDFIGANG